MEEPLLDARDLLHRMYLPMRDNCTRSEIATHTLYENSHAPTVFQHPEWLLQAAWEERRWIGRLRTQDRRTLEVVFPGIRNREPGPDFHDAVLLLDGHRRTGAVEVHRRTSDWFRHHHHQDPAYRAVLLHVVFRDDATPEQANRLPPCLELGTVLPPPVESLVDELTESYCYTRRARPGHCVLWWSNGDQDRIRTLLTAAGLARFADKSIRMRRSIREHGPDQALYMALFEALGYKANRAPFRALAREVPICELRKLNHVDRVALLYGTAKLLPDPGQARTATAARRARRRLWDRFWATGKSPLDLAWERTRTRPCNRPERRLAAGVTWVKRADTRIGRWLLDEAAKADNAVDLLRRMRQLLEAPAEECPEVTECFGVHPGGALVGRDRVMDVLGNVALPFLAAVGRDTGDTVLYTRAEETFAALPKLQNNRRLQEATHRFLMPPSLDREVLQRGVHQQGMMALYDDFCTRVGHDCANCPFAVNTAVDQRPVPD